MALPKRDKPKQMARRERLALAKRLRFAMVELRGDMLLSEAITRLEAPRRSGRPVSKWGGPHPYDMYVIVQALVQLGDTIEEACLKYARAEHAKAHGSAKGWRAEADIEKAASAAKRHYKKYKRTPELYENEFLHAEKVAQDVRRARRRLRSLDSKSKQ